MTQSIEEQIRILATIEAKLHLFQVRCKMLCADVMPCSGDSALQKGESGFDVVGVNIPASVFFLAVCDGLMPLSVLASFPKGEWVLRRVIGENHVHILADVLADILCQRSRLCVLRVEEAEIAIALADSEYHFFVVHPADTALPYVLAAYIGFVKLNRAVEHLLLTFDHRGPDSMTEKPRSLVATNPERPLNLTSGNSLFRLAEKVRSEKPLSQRQVRVMEYSSRSHAKLVAAIGAFKFALREQARNCFTLASRASDAFGPTQPFQKFAASIFGSVFTIQLSEVHSHVS